MRIKDENYRNHRKIVVIDGKIGYTGGINIGDEYIYKRALGSFLFDKKHIIWYTVLNTVDGLSILYNRKRRG